MGNQGISGVCAIARTCAISEAEGFDLVSDIVIRAEDLGKCYHIDPVGNTGYRTVREDIGMMLASPFQLVSRTIRGRTLPAPEEFWALQRVSFDIHEGEVVGIIGRNGAGKTTLLKVLSRITDPTHGRAFICGRVGSLLEVGTGFHPELTGRENVYLSGAILGMRRSEIRSKFDEIVAFAEIERFLNTPVKRYSSGMYVRLAFSVAAHLEPEILLIDEVLAVGDLAFQKKCLGKMGGLAQGGRTVLFVSHHMNSVRNLCERSVWLEGGGVCSLGATRDVVSEYEKSFASTSWQSGDTRGTLEKRTRFLRWRILESDEDSPNLLMTRERVTLEFLLHVEDMVLSGVHGLALWNGERQLVWGWKIDGLRLMPGTHVFTYALPYLPLRPGVYYWQVSIFDGAVPLDVWYGVPEMIVDTKPLGHPDDRWAGVIDIPVEFALRSEEG